MGRPATIGHYFKDWSEAVIALQEYTHAYTTTTTTTQAMRNTSQMPSECLKPQIVPELAWSSVLFFCVQTCMYLIYKLGTGKG